jgi:hypothetical protein
VGTHAHEVMSIFAQLLADCDDAAGGDPSTPVQVHTTLRIPLLRIPVHLHRSSSWPGPSYPQQLAACAALLSAPGAALRPCASTAAPA